MFRVFTGGNLFDEERDSYLRAQICNITIACHTTPEKEMYRRVSENTPEVLEDDRRQLARILAGLIVGDPERRLSALKLEEDPWFQY
jgi:hypothetical protein